MNRRFGPIKADIVTIVLIESDSNASLSLEPGGWQLATPVCEVCKVASAVCVAFVKYNAEIEKCERLTKLYKDTHERAMRDTEAANDFFGFGRNPRCLECSSHDVRSEGAEGLPHGCGEPLHWEQLTRERGTFVGAELRYYDNDGLIVRKETKF